MNIKTIQEYRFIEEVIKPLVESRINDYKKKGKEYFAKHGSEFILIPFDSENIAETVFSSGGVTIDVKGSRFNFFPIDPESIAPVIVRKDKKVDITKIDPELADLIIKDYQLISKSDIEKRLKEIHGTSRLGLSTLKGMDKIERIMELMPDEIASMLSVETSFYTKKIKQPELTDEEKKAALNNKDIFNLFTDVNKENLTYKQLTYFSIIIDKALKEAAPNFYFPNIEVTNYSLKLKDDYDFSGYSYSELDPVMKNFLKPVPDKYEIQEYFDKIPENAKSEKEIFMMFKNVRNDDDIKYFINNMLYNQNKNERKPERTKKEKKANSQEVGR